MPMMTLGVSGDILNTEDKVCSFIGVIQLGYSSAKKR